eukprot:5191413-Amphidinium_carterae.1
MPSCLLPTAALNWATGLQLLAKARNALRSAQTSKTRTKSSKPKATLHKPGRNCRLQSQKLLQTTCTRSIDHENKRTFAWAWQGANPHGTRARFGL